MEVIKGKHLHMAGWIQQVQSGGRGRDAPSHIISQLFILQRILHWVGILGKGKSPFLALVSLSQ